MSLLRGIAGFRVILDRAKDSTRRCIAAGILVLLGALVVLGAVGFALAGLYIRLAEELPDHLAAFSIAAGLGAVGAVLIAAARAYLRPGAGRAARREPASAISEGAEDAAERAVRAAMDEVRTKPASALGTALLVGLIVGLLRRDRD